MLNHLRIKNFKGWRDTGPIQMAPITLFFGANSSGKSSIGQFLMMLKQTVELQDRKAVVYAGGKNSAVQLGSYKEMVFHRDLKNKLEFEYQWSPLKAFTIDDPITQHSFLGNTVSFQATVGPAEIDEQTISVNRFEYELFDKSKSSMSISMERKSDSKSQYKVDAVDYVLKRKQGRVWYPGAPVRFYGFPDEVVAYHQNAEFVQTLNLLHEKLFRSLCYLGPLRTKADRLYSWTGTEPESVGYSGENTVAAILAARGRKISIIKPNAKRASAAKPFEQVIAENLKVMGLIDDFEVKAISKQRQEYEVKLRTKGATDWVDLPDVGFGISQVLPVLVQCYYAPPGSIILMEQPEIHLHPLAQSGLADVLIDAINSRENGEDRNIQLVIETHSEHFLRRIQRRIAEDVVARSRVSAYFANVSKSPATLEPLQIDLFGNILNWPEHFFGDEMGDVTAQAKAAMKTRMHQASEKSGTSQ